MAPPNREEGAGDDEDEEEIEVEVGMEGVDLASEGKERDRARLRGMKGGGDREGSWPSSRKPPSEPEEEEEVDEDEDVLSPLSLSLSSDWRATARASL